MASSCSNSFWGRVRQRNLDLGYDMKDLARVSGVAYSTIYRYIDRTVPPKQETIEALASALGCSVNYLLTGAEKEHNTLSPDLMELISHFKILTDGQKQTVRQLIDQFTRDNQKYAEIYLELHPVEK